MAAIRTHTDLQNAIRELEDRQAKEKDLVEDHFNESIENIKPVNIIKHTVEEINESTEFKGAVIKAAVALAIGYITKKLIDRLFIKSKNPIILKVGTVLEVVVSAWVAKNATLMKDIAMHFIKVVMNKRAEQKSLPSKTIHI